MEIDWHGLAKIQTIQEKAEMVDGIIRDCKPDDPIYLSDCIVRGGADGSVVLVALAAQEQSMLISQQTPMLWKILVEKDEWGNVPNPGDIVYKVNKKPLKKNGKAMSQHVLNVAKMDGSYDDLFYDKRPYTVDEKGCITCSFTDAGHFLHTRGKHSKSNRPMTTQRETSTEPVLAPDGKMHLIHYWLYKEITPEAYEKLEKRPISKKPKVGHANASG